MRKLWSDWIVAFFDFAWKCIRRALFSRTWLTVISAVSVPAAMIVAWLTYKHPNWSGSSQALASVVFTCMIPLAAAIAVALFRLIVSPFLVYKSAEADHANKLSDVIRDRDNVQRLLSWYQNIALQRRLEERKRLFEACAKMLKEQKIAMLPFHAVSRVGAYNLEQSEDLSWICDELAKLAFGGHPFADLDEYVPAKDQLDFLRWVNLYTNYDATKGIDYLMAAEQWRSDHGYPEPSQKTRLTLTTHKAMEK